MNNDRRKRINSALIKLAKIQDDVQMIYDEEEMAFDSLPENLKDSDRGCCMQDAIGHLEEAVQSMEELIESLADAVSY